MVSVSRAAGPKWELYDLKADPAEKTDVAGSQPEQLRRMQQAYDQWWESILPCLENENAVGPKVNPFKELYWKQFGGGPDDALRREMNPAALPPAAPGPK